MSGLLGSEKALDRRLFLCGLGSFFLPIARSSQADNAPGYLACCRTKSGEYGAAVISSDLEILHIEPLDARGHDAALNPNGDLAVVFARRPGRFAVVIDVLTRNRRFAFAPPEGRHFYGHGFFSTDGKLLFATENDYENERGELGIYNATNGFSRVGAFDTGGIGPHEALLLSDGKTIAIANGGIVTHPDFPRQKLNLANMSPSLSLVDIETGGLIENAALPPHFHQLSIRHMAEAGDGSIWFGGQYEGAVTDEVGLVGVYRRGEGIELIEAPAPLYRRMNQYIGSVSADRSGEFIATTSPRGGQVIVWDAARKRPSRVFDHPDISGVAASRGSFLFSDGRGGLLRGGSITESGLQWDNHMLSIATGR
ncbi:MAG: DUF1513 domain-containing protein [Pseudomonadota bacterium]